MELEYIRGHLNNLDNIMAGEFDQLKPHWIKEGQNIGGGLRPGQKPAGAPKPGEELESEFKTKSPCILASIKHGRFRTREEMATFRETLTLDVLPENWREIFEKEGDEGASDAAIILALGLTRQKFRILLEEFPEFADKYAEFTLRTTIWWEKAGRNLTIGAYTHGKSSAWAFTMTNRFGWRNRNELSGDQNNPISVKQEIKTDASITDEDLFAELERRGVPVDIFNPRLKAAPVPTIPQPKSEKRTGFDFPEDETGEE